MSVRKYSFDVEMLRVAQLLKLRVIELPVSIEMKAEFNLRDIIRILIDLLGIAFFRNVYRCTAYPLYNGSQLSTPYITLSIFW